MLLYRPSILHEKWIQLQALIGACAIYALVVFMLVIPHDNEQVTTIAISLHNNPKPVLFMDMKKKRPIAASSVLSSNNGMPKKVAQSPNFQKQIEIAENKKKNEPKKHAHIPQKEPQKKIQQNKTERPEIVPAPKTKKESNKIKASKNKKSLAQVPKVKEKKEQQEKLLSEAKTIEVQKSDIDLEQKKKKVPYPQPTAIAQQIIPLPTDMTEAQKADEIEIGQEYDPTLKAHYALSNAVARVWKKPAVVSKKPVKIIASINQQGRAENLSIEESSGIPVYDIAARAAILRAEFPKDFYGKKVALLFGEKSIS
jgi:hypothetical protein